MADGGGLTAEQTDALLDILTHYETYAEVEAFKFPDAVASYGYPFASAAGGDDGSGDDGSGDDIKAPSSSSPLLQALLGQLVLTAPGVADLPREFWSVRVQGLLRRMGDAELSESYDKGALGTRKTLATGASALVEMVARGVLAGLSPRPAPDRAAQYDCGRADHLARAWDDVAQALVYGDLVDGLFDHAATTEHLESLSPAVKAAADYALIHLAAFAHRVFIASADGPYLLKLVENVHGLMPYKLIRQTLRVGNAATMMSAMVRLLLAKLSVTGLTNWFGLTANADDGMNLLQRIISLVLSWDAGEFRKSVDRIDRDKGHDRPADNVLQAMRDHVAAGRTEHEAVRAASIERSQSIVAAILDASAVGPTPLTEAQHARCLEYYSALLSVRDRDCIAAALCRQPPDLFTQMIKDAVAAYDPIIRNVHARVDVKEHLDALQGFVDDFIRASKPTPGPDGQDRLPGVNDYIDLLRRNRGLTYRWVHAIASRCPDVWEEFRRWAKDAAASFRQRDPTDAMTDGLNRLIASLEPSVRGPVLKAINAHAAYLASLHDLSLARLARLVAPVDSASDSDSDSGCCGSDSPGPFGLGPGPGVYLARWQGLLDSTPVTPDAARGTVRRGRDVRHATTMGKTGVGGRQCEAAPNQQQDPEAPDVAVVIGALAADFRALLGEMQDGRTATRRHGS